MIPDWFAWPEIKTLAAAFKPGELRFVGGAVRDALLSRAVTDVDAATTLTPDQVTQKLEAAGIRAIPTGIAHGTVTALINGKPFEITTLRKDVSTDGRHATVEFTDDWKADASRRDFTMNAMYLTPGGELFDYFGGSADAKAGRVRFIGDADARIKEDYLRVLRFFRFYARYGKGEPDFNALSACAQNAEGLSALSGERIQQEMFKLLAAPNAYKTLLMMQREGILSQIFGQYISLGKLHLLSLFTKSGLKMFFEGVLNLILLLFLGPNAVRGSSTYYYSLGKDLRAKINLYVRLGMLLPNPQSLEYIAKRWKLSNSDKEHLSALISNTLGSKTALAEQKKLLRRVGPERFTEILLINIGAFKSLRQIKKAAKLAKRWTPPVFPVTGEDLKALGMAEGKALGECLRRLEEKWEESDYQMTKEELLKDI